MQKRAAVGGERGTNGEWYEGGKFLPSTQQPKRRAIRSRGTGKVLVAPGEWAELPESKISIFSRLSVFVGNLGADGKLAINSRFDADHPAVHAYSNGMDELQDLVSRFNAGERWLDA